MIDKSKVTDDNNISFNISYALDEGEFLRRECPSCGLQFKTQVSPAQLTGLITPAIQKIYNETHNIENDQAEQLTSEVMTCPYCGQENSASAFFTQEFNDYILRWASREIVFPALENFQNTISQMYSGSKSNSKDFFSLTMKVEKSENYKPIRPISGPEVPDMRIVNLLCSNEKIKIYENWGETLFCPVCANKVLLT